jgi:hypothetical protein
MQTHDSHIPDGRRVAALSTPDPQSIAKMQGLMLQIDTASRQHLRIQGQVLRNADFVSIRTRAAIIAMKRFMDEVARCQDSTVCRSCGDISWEGAKDCERCTDRWYHPSHGRFAADTAGP